MRYAVIEKGTVANIAIATPEHAAKMGWVSADGGRIGDGWDGKAFIPQPDEPQEKPEPQSDAVDLAQALVDAGALRQEDLPKQFRDAIEAKKG